MGKFLLVEPSLSDACLDAFFKSHETTWAPASNLHLSQPKEVMETTDVTGTIELRYDLRPSTPSYDFFALLFSNATDACTVAWEGSNTYPGQGTWTASNNAWSSGTSATTPTPRL